MLPELFTRYIEVPAESSRIQVFTPFFWNTICEETAVLPFKINWAVPVADVAINCARALAPCANSSKSIEPAVEVSDQVAVAATDWVNVTPLKVIGLRIDMLSLTTGPMII